MNNQTIEMLMKIQKVNRFIQQDNQEIHAEQMNDASVMNTKSNITVSMLFENQDQTNQHRDIEQNLIDDFTIQSPILLQPITKGEWISSHMRTYSNRIKRYNLSTDHWKQSSKLIPNYRNLSQSTFKDLLVQTIPATDCHLKVDQCLTDSTVLQFMQQRAELMCTVFQLKIEQDYWNYIVNLTMPTVIWLSEVSKDVTKQNSINWDHTKTKNNIRHRLEIIQSHLQRVEHTLNIHLQQSYPFSWQIQNKTTMDHSMKIISNALIVIIQKSLYYFRTNFDQKKILIMFDTEDVNLVKSFYNTNPTEEQIRSVQEIWRIKFKSCQRALRQKKKRSSIINQDTIKGTIQDSSSLMNQLLSTGSFIPSMCTIIEARLTNFEQRAQQLMQFSNTINDNIFF